MAAQQHWIGYSENAGNAQYFLPVLGVSPHNSVLTTSPLAIGVISEAGTLKAFRIRYNVAATGAGNKRFRLLLNGSPSATYDVTFNSGDTFHEVVSDVSVSAGDYVAIQVDYTTTQGGVGWHMTDIVFEPTTAGRFCYPSSSSTSSTISSAPVYKALLGKGDVQPQSTSSIMTRSVIAFAGTLRAFYVRLNAAPGSGKGWTLIVEQNGSEVAATSLTISDTNQTGNVTGLSVSVAAGDQLAFKVKTKTGTAAATVMQWGVTIEPTTSGLFHVGGVWSTTGGLGDSDISNSANRFQGWGLVKNDTTETVASSKFYLEDALTITRFYLACTTAPGSGKSVQYLVRKNAANGNNTVTISDANTTGNDTGHSDSYSAGDYFDLETLPSSTPSQPVDVSFGFAFSGAVPTETGTIGASLTILSASMTGAEEESGTLSATLPIVTAALLREQIDGSLTTTLTNLSASMLGTEEERGDLAATLALVAAAMTVIGPTDNGNMVATLAALVFAAYGPARDRSFSRPTSPTRANVFIRSAWPPFPVIAELTTANNVNASWVRMDAGLARLYIHESDPQLRAGILRPGNLLSIEYPSLPVWAGPLRNWPHRLSSGEWEINVSDLVSILDNRDMPQDAVVSAPIGWDQRVRNALTQANARALTGVFLPSILEIGPQVDEMQEGGQSLKAFLDQGHAETDYEWWLDIEADRAHLKAELHIGYRQGDDLSARLHLWNGLHFSEVEYKPDFTQIKQAMTMFGDFGALLRERQSVARVGPGGPHDIGAITESMAPLSLDSLETLPPGVRNEQTEFNLMTGNDRQLSKSAARAIERPLLAAEQFTLTTNRLFDWKYARVGNRLTTHTGHGFTNLVRTPRVVAVQVDFDRGELVLATEVG